MLESFTLKHKTGEYCVPYMTKALRKAIMKRSELETKFHKSKTELSQRVFRKQRNYVSKLYKIETKIYYEKLVADIPSQ